MPTRFTLHGEQPAERRHGLSAFAPPARTLAVLVLVLDPARHSS